MHSEWLWLARQGDRIQTQFIEQSDRRVSRPPGYRPSVGVDFRDDPKAMSTAGNQTPSARQGSELESFNIDHEPIGFEPMFIAEPV